MDSSNAPPAQAEPRPISAVRSGPPQRRAPRSSARVESEAAPAIWIPSSASTCPSVREMSAGGRLPAAPHGADLPQLRSELVHQRTIDDAGAQRGAISVVVVHLEGAEHQVPQLREWGPVAQPGDAAAFRPTRAAA